MEKKVLFCLTSLKVRKVQKSRADTVNLKHSSKSFWRSAGQPASVWLGYRRRLTANAFSGCHGYTDKSMHQWSENTNALTQSHALLLLQLCSLISGQRKLVDTFPFSSVLLTVLTHTWGADCYHSRLLRVSAFSNMLKTLTASWHSSVFFCLKLSK